MNWQQAKTKGIAAIFTGLVMTACSNDTFCHYTTIGTDNHNSCLEKRRLDDKNDHFDKLAQKPRYWAMRHATEYFVSNETEIAAIDNEINLQAYLEQKPPRTNAPFTLDDLQTVIEASHEHLSNDFYKDPYDRIVSLTQKAFIKNRDAPPKQGNNLLSAAGTQDPRNENATKTHTQELAL